MSNIKQKETDPQIIKILQQLQELNSRLIQIEKFLKDNI